MFNFGDAEATAQLFWENALSETGPAIPDAPYDEMMEQDLRNVFAYLYMAVLRAQHEGAADDVVEILLKQYDEVFQALADASEAFREAVRTHRHRYIGGYTKENVKKYRDMAGV